MKKGLVKNLVTLGLVGTLLFVVIYGTFTSKLDDDFKTVFTAMVSSVVTFYLGFQMNKVEK